MGTKPLLEHEHSNGQVSIHIKTISTQIQTVMWAITEHGSRGELNKWPWQLDAGKYVCCPAKYGHHYPTIQHMHIQWLSERKVWTCLWLISKWQKIFKCPTDKQTWRLNDMCVGSTVSQYDYLIVFYLVIILIQTWVDKSPVYILLMWSDTHWEYFYDPTP